MMRTAALAILAAFLASCSKGNARDDGGSAGTGVIAGVGGIGGDGAGGFGGSAGAAGGSGAGGAGGAAAIGFSWRALPRLAKKRQNAMGAAVGGTMYVIGGLSEGGLVVDVERLEPGQAAWTAAPPLPSPQCCAAVGVLGDVIALAGGYEADGQTPTNAFVLFDSTTGAWRAGPPMPTARANAMGAVWNGKLMVIGGGSPLQVTGIIETYDPASNTWTASTLTVTPRVGGTAVVDADRTYVIGGAVQNSLYGDAIVEVIAADRVSAGPPLGFGRVQVVGGLLPAGLVVAGGWTAEGHTARAEGLFGARSTWQSLPPMPTSRAGAAAAVVEGSLIVAGGGQFDGAWVYQDAVEALRAD